MEHLRKRRTAFFNECADRWEDADSFPDVERKVRRIIEPLEGLRGENVLDVGTGTGIALEPLREKVGPEGRVVGIDLAAKMLQRAKRKSSALVRGDIHNLPFPSGIFRLAFAFAVLPHLDDKTIFFSEAARVLKSGGLLIVLHLMSREECNDFHRKAGTAVEQDMLPAAEELNLMAKQTGFTPRECREDQGLFYWSARRV